MGITIGNVSDKTPVLDFIIDPCVLSPYYSAVGFSFKYPKFSPNFKTPTFNDKLFRGEAVCQ